MDAATRTWVYALIVGTVWGLIVWASTRDAEKAWHYGAFTAVGLAMYGVLLVA